MLTAVRSSGLVLDSSAEAARGALEIIWGGAGEGELAELSVLKGKKWRTVHCSVAEAIGGGLGRGEDGVDALRRASRDGGSAYFGACLLNGRPGRGRRGGAGLRSSAGALWIDVDCAAPGREGPGYFSGVEEAVAAVDAGLDEVLGVGSRASERVLVIGSGWGVQYWLPLSGRVSAAVGSRMTRVLVEEIAGSGAVGGKKIDQLFDVTRVMRMPGTWNWRAGNGVGLEQETGVLRWPAAAAGKNTAFRTEGLRGFLEAKRSGSSAVSGGGGGGGRLKGVGAGAGGGPLLDVETLCDRIWTWDDVLVPFGWTRTEVPGGIAGWVAGGRELSVWGRPGRAGERSAVVFADEPDLLVVFSDSRETGFVSGLRRGKAGDGAAGAGVISKWRAWTDLGWDGDWKAAGKAVWEGAVGGGGIGGGGVLAVELGRELDMAREIVGEWVDLASESVWGEDRVGALEKLAERKRAAQRMER